MDALAGDEEAVDDGDIGVSASRIIELASACFAGLRPGEMTIRQYADETGLRYQQAAYRLNKLAEQGLIEKRTVLHDGANRLAFSWIGGDESDG